ncbi:transposase [Pseudoxanthomonas putridarboris]|uniref:Transposase n=2 Tax=Pseudoxanthomonas putridarboris TaxID=752605 RepID=A0ABU9J404_9GAMM
MRFPRTGHAALRRHRIDLPDQVYLITATTADRQPLFGAFEGACAAAPCHHQPDVLRTSVLLAWVLMPDHAHWLVRLGERDGMASFTNRLKSAIARAYNHRLERTGPVWARAYHDHALRQEEDVRVAARYVVANPVRAGLVKRVGDYPFWNAVWL